MRRRLTAARGAAGEMASQVISQCRARRSRICWALFRVSVLSRERACALNSRRRLDQEKLTRRPPYCKAFTVTPFPSRVSPVPWVAV